MIIIIIIIITTTVFAAFNKESGNDGDKSCLLPGYELVPGVGYYKLYGQGEKRTWADAKAVCESDGGHLAVIDTETELLYVRMIASTFNKETAYISIGLHDNDKEGEFVTIFSKSISI